MKKTTTLWDCDFCGESEHKVKLMIAGPSSIAICNECVALCDVIVAEAAAAKDAQRQQQTNNERKD